MIKLFGRLIEAGILILIVLTPLMFGSVNVRNYCIMQFVAFTLVIIWMAKMILSGHYEFKRTIIDWFFLAFVALVLFQLIPLPPKVVKTLSPSTYALYNQSVPDYDMEFQEENVNQAAVALAGFALFTKTNSLRRWPSLSIYAHATKTLLLKVLAYLAVFYLIINTLGRKQLTRVAWVIVLVGFFEAIYGALEYFSGHHHIFFFKKNYYLDSLTGTFFNRNHLAGYLGMAIPLSLGLAFASANTRSWEEASRNPSSFRGQKHLEIMISVFPLYMLLSLVFTQSRMGMICVLISLIVFHRMLQPRDSGVERRYSIGGAIILSAFVFVIFLGVTPILQRFSTIPSEFNPGGRWHLWATTANICKDFPFLGTGFGTFEFIFPKYMSSGLPAVYEHAHNDYLELLSDTGAVGFALMVTGLTLLSRRIFVIWTRRHDKYIKDLALGAAVGIFSLSIHGVADFNMHIPSNALLFFVLLGACFGIVNIRSRHGRAADCNNPIEQEPRQSKGAALVASLIILVCVVLLAETYAVYVGDRSYRAAMSGCYTASEKESLLKRAIAEDPSNAQYPYELAQLNTPQAVRALKTATALNPTIAHYWHALGVMVRSPTAAGRTIFRSVQLDRSQSD